MTAERKVQATLWSDGGEESEKAAALLDEADIEYLETVFPEETVTKWRNEGVVFPRLLSLAGQFEGITSDDTSDRTIQMLIHYIENTPAKSQYLPTFPVLLFL